MRKAKGCFVWSSPASFTPVFFRFAPHGRCIRVLHFERASVPRGKLSPCECLRGRACRHGRRRWDRRKPIPRTQPVVLDASPVGAGLVVLLEERVAARLVLADAEPFVEGLSLGFVASLERVDRGEESELRAVHGGELVDFTRPFRRIALLDPFLVVRRPKHGRRVLDFQPPTLLRRIQL
jgi:hypothetical protein